MYVGEGTEIYIGVGSELPDSVCTMSVRYIIILLTAISYSPGGPFFTKDGQVNRTIIGDMMYAKAEIQNSTDSARAESDWVVVQSLRGFLESFREHAKHLGADELGTMLENLEGVGSTWCCPFTDIDIHEIEDSESYQKNSEVFEFMDNLLAGIFDIAYELLLERQADTIVEEVGTDMPVIPQGLPRWEREALAFYNAVEG